MKLVVEDVSKKYKGNIWGLKDFSIELESGILGLLGPNGAGKSTLMRILATITKPTSGKVYWNGKDIVKHPNELRNVLGYLPQDFNVYPNLNALEFLEYMAAIKGLHGKSAKNRIDELLQILNLSENRKKPLGGFSGGMRQRVGIAQALLNDPKLLIVDEPTSGLDPEERVRFRGLLSDLSGDRIVILSSHICSDVEATAMNIAIIKKGHLLSHEMPEDLMNKVDGKVWEVLVHSDKVADLKSRFLISSTARRKDGILARILNDNKPTENAVSAAPKLEDAYLYFTSRNGELK